MTSSREATVLQGEPKTSSTAPTDSSQPLGEAPPPSGQVWRYPEMCEQWGVSRATVERWVRRFESTGEGIPVRRDPSGRPYWLAVEASPSSQPAEPTATVRPTVRPSKGDELGRLRRAASRGRRS